MTVTWTLVWDLARDIAVLLAYTVAVYEGVRLLLTRVASPVLAWGLTAVAFVATIFWWASVSDRSGPWHSGAVVVAWMVAVPAGRRERKERWARDRQRDGSR